jgi:hypothetical protein
MADVRINALATTATGPASDDFVAFDGTTNGTRKFAAPSFAMNDRAQTFTGTQTFSGAISGTTATFSGGSVTLDRNSNANNQITLSNNDAGAAAGGNIRITDGTRNSYVAMDGNGSGASIRKNVLGLYNDAVGVSLQAVNAAGVIEFITGADSAANVRGRFTAAGALELFNGLTFTSSSTVLSQNAANVLQLTGGTTAQTLLIAGNGYNNTGDVRTLGFGAGTSAIYSTLVDAGAGTQDMKFRTWNAGAVVALELTAAGNGIFAGSVTSAYGSFAAPGLILGDSGYGAYVSGGNLYFKSASGGNIYFRKTDDSTNSFSFDTATGAFVGTSATFSGAVTLTSTNHQIIIQPASGSAWQELHRKTTSDLSLVQLFTDSTADWGIGTAAGASDFVIYTYGASLNAISVARATGITTFGAGITGTTATFSGLLGVGGSTPASAGASGTAGTITWDASYIYICTATNTWKRVAIATW